MDLSCPDDSSAAREAIDWMIALHDAVRGEGDLDTLVPRFRQWVLAAPENHLAFCEVRELWLEISQLTDPAQGHLLLDLERPPAG